ncbi:hypothetical protein BGW80DRAFT_879649 [Lactifluus volemus]|nr:hypothetical protein BGW80DRAFT_879649 [Lactifluus volemus]
MERAVLRETPEILTVKATLGLVFRFPVVVVSSIRFSRSSTCAIIEAQDSFSLSRVPGTPNIASKGTLELCLVAVPATLFPPGHRHRARSVKTSTLKLIEELCQ